jgi:hypothetical protein
MAVEPAAVVFRKRLGANPVDGELVDDRAGSRILHLHGEPIIEGVIRAEGQGRADVREQDEKALNEQVDRSE